MNSRISVPVLLLLLCLCLNVHLLAQARGPGKPSKNVPLPGSTPPGMPDLTPANVFFTGKVVIDDGTEITEPVAIQTMCNGVKHTEAYSDSRGGFSFQFANRATANNNMVGLGDADTSLVNPTGNRNTQRDFRNCQLEGYLPGFSSELVELAGRGGLGSENIDVGRITLHRIAQVQGLTISATSAAAPGSAKKAFAKGLDKERKDKWEDAEKDFQKAVDEYPKFAVAWNELGRVHAHNKDWGSANECYQRALAADAQYAAPYQGLTFTAFAQQKWSDVVNSSSRLLSLNPINFPDAWFYNALGNFFLHDFQAAEKSARQGIRIDSDHRVPKLEYLLGLVLANTAHYAEASQHMRQFIKSANNAADVAEGQKKLAEIERLSAAAVPVNK